MKRSTIFFISVAYLLTLLGVGVLFFIRRQCFILAFGPVPIGVPWYGAVGAILLSLEGVFMHDADWEVGFWPWHVARPLVGASLGIVSVLIVQAGILAVGSSPAAAAPQQQLVAVPANLLYYLIAFLVGYREETFRALIKRLADVILTPGDPGPPPPRITAVNPAEAVHNQQTPGLIISGSGFTGTASVTFGGTPAVGIHVDSDTQLTLTAPVVPAAGIVPLVVTTANGSTTFQFTYT